MQVSSFLQSQTRGNSQDFGNENIFHAVLVRHPEPALPRNNGPNEEIEAVIRPFLEPVEPARGMGPTHHDLSLFFDCARRNEAAVAVAPDQARPSSRRSPVAGTSRNSFPPEWPSVKQFLTHSMVCNVAPVLLI